MNHRTRPIAALFAMLIVLGSVPGAALQVLAAEPPYTRVSDVVYGRVYGTALTMDVFTPRTHPNGRGVIAVVSGGWFSSHDAIDSAVFAPTLSVLTGRGYTVFAVVHGSNPKFTIPEILPQISRAVRFIRFHAADYHVDPYHLGITGGSAGGHLSLMQGCDPVPADPKAADPVDRISARVQAVVAFFPPTDFLNYGRPDHEALGRNELSWLKGPFDFHELDKKTGTFRIIAEDARIRAIGREISPINHVSSACPPTLLIHGDADKLVPLQQSQIMVAALEKAGVPCRLIVKHGAGHGWPHNEPDLNAACDWFDIYLLGKSAPATQPAGASATTQPAAP